MSARLPLRRAEGVSRMLFVLSPAGVPAKEEVGAPLRPAGKRSAVDEAVSPALRSRAWLAAAWAFVAIRALPNISYPIGRDQATFLVIGRELLRGQALYRQLWDNKPPGIFFIFAGIAKAFGPVMWSVGLMDFAWLLGISYLIFRFAERYVGPGAAAVAVLINATWHVRQGYWGAAQAETFLMLFVFASFFAAAPAARLEARARPSSRLRHAAAGLLFGVAFWIKYNALAFLPVLLV